MNTIQPREENGRFSHKSGTGPEVSLMNTRYEQNLVPLTPVAQDILQACRAAGGKPLIVGGAVRDALRGDAGGAGHDIDIEVHEVKGLRDLIPHLAKVGNVSEVGASFGVLKVTVGDEDYDVSVPRRESKTGAGHRGFEVVVDPTMNAHDAFARRDFTINAIGWEPDTGEVIDPFNGERDLEDGILRHTSDAFDDDPLRVLRGMQFAARFGMTMHPDTVALCRGIKDRFDELPASRVYGEFVKLISSDEPSAGLRVLKETGWVEHFPELNATIGLPQDVRWHPEADVYEHQSQAADVAARLATERGLEGYDRTVVVMAAMLHDVGKATTTITHDDGRITSAGHAEDGTPMAVELLKRSGFPQVVQARVAPLVGEHMFLHSWQKAGKTGDAALRRLVRRLEPATLEEWALVAEADVRGRSGALESAQKRFDQDAVPQTPAWDWVARSREISAERPAPGLLRGEHLMAEGMKPGPDFRPIMDAAREAQDDGEFTDEAGAVAWLRNRLSL
jgi:tRNA nucleotidyltransferase (CCA-adding enzyme)